MQGLMTNTFVERFLLLRSMIGPLTSSAQGVRLADGQCRCCPSSPTGCIGNIGFCTPPTVKGKPDGCRPENA